MSTKTHGMFGTRIYNIWAQMIQRCHNPKAKMFYNYGAKGIAVCDEWRDFTRFYVDMGEPAAHQTLDRINGALGYSKDNCRWADDVQQARNKRTNRLLEYQGETLPMVEWAERLNLCYVALKKRMQEGWTVERALSTPTRKPYVPHVPGSNTRTPRVRASRSTVSCRSDASG